MDFKKLSIEELELKFSEIEKKTEAIENVVGKIDGLVNILCDLKKELLPFVSKKEENKSKIDTIVESGVEPGQKKQFLKDLLTQYELTTRTSFEKLVELGKASPIDSEEGSRQYKTHRTVISNMLGSGEIESADGKERNCIWRVVK